MIILIDNYDSFTWNLWHFLSDLGAEVTTIRNDAKSVEEILAMQPSGLVLSPGPGVPADAGILVDLIKAAPASLPIMGVCLGHQAICTAFGGKLKHFSPPRHGVFPAGLALQQRGAATPHQNCRPISASPLPDWQAGPAS